MTVLLRPERILSPAYVPNRVFAYPVVIAEPAKQPLAVLALPEVSLARAPTPKAELPEPDDNLDKESTPYEVLYIAWVFPELSVAKFLYNPPNNKLLGSA